MLKILNKIGIKTRLDFLFLFLSLFIILGTYFTKVAPHHFENKWWKNKGAKTEFFEKQDRYYSKKEGKKVYFEHLGKTENQIQIDKIASSYLHLSWILPNLAPKLFNSYFLGGYYAASIASTYIVTHILKYAIDKERPDKGNFRSFPSGHSAGSAVLPAFLHKFYSFKVASPFYIAAIVVGGSRIYCDRHDIIDVTGGFLIGFISGYFINTMLLICINFMAKKYSFINKIKIYLLQQVVK